MIPLCICEKGEKYIDMVRCYGTKELRENKLFVSFCSNLNLHINKKVVFNNRNVITDILRKCNCVISTTQEWDLNYVFLECFYYGIPLIHNSKILEDYGYYYPDLDINMAVEQIETVFKTHNTKLYIEKHKPLLYKYSIHNTYYQEWVKSRLDR
jgi:aspartyl-tRNA synthetase